MSPFIFSDCWSNLALAEGLTWMHNRPVPQVINRAQVAHDQVPSAIAVAWLVTVRHRRISLNTLSLE